MYLSKLELHGFKSFAQKTTVRFDSGITAIVGPNGCGKTNVADAIRWVLGEQKASTLRSDKMENVIFNGTRTRKPLGMAEISLSIENTKNILPTEYSEVIITRRLYRSGESEYLLNKIPCRLKDIVDLFMDTGMGPDAYSVIELKMIEDILSERYDDRRRLFEEAAGVTKYKTRRKQALRKLEQTRHDLERINDIIAEVHKNVLSLERQAKKAELYEIYTRELRELDLNWSEREYSSLRIKLDPLKDKLKTVSHDLETASTILLTDDAALEKINLDWTRVQNELSMKQKEFNSHVQSVQREEEGIAIRKERRKNLEESIARYEREIAEIKEQADNLRIPESEISGRIENLKNLVESAETAYQLVQETFTSFEQSVTEKRAEMASALQKIQALNRELSQKETEKERLIARRDSSVNRIEVLKREILTVSESLEEVIAELDERRYDLKKAAAFVVEEELRLRQVENSLELKRKELEDAKLAVSTLDVEISNQKNKKSFLLSVLENHEDLPDGTRALIRSGKIKNTRTLADVLSVTEESHIPVIHRWLGERAALLLADTAEEAMGHLKELGSAGKGTAGFIIRERIQAPETTAPEIAGAKPLASLIRSSESDQNLVATLCWGIYLADSGSAAATLHAKYPAFTFLSADGFIFSDKAVVRGGRSENARQSRLGVEDKIKQIDSELTRLDERKSQLQKAVGETQTALDTLLLSRSDQALADGRRKQSELERQVVQLETALQSSQKRTDFDQQEIQRLEQESRSLEQQLEDLQPEIDEFNWEIKKFQTANSSLQETLKTLESEWSTQSAQLQEARAKFITFRSQRENAENELKRISAQKDDLTRRIERRLQDITESNNQIQILHQEVSEAEKNLVSLYQNRDQLSGVIEQLEVRQSELRGEVNRIESALREHRMQKETLLTLKSQYELKIQETEIAIQNLCERIMNEYGVELVVKEFDESEDLDAVRLADEVRRYRERIRGLGNVNTGALDEFRETRERYDFMITQRDDLVSAEQDLKQVIDEINQTAQSQFQSVFAQIRENFHSTFSTLFEPGDEADLILEENPDPLEAKIEIIAKPRGKRPQSITLLSGGEKTLTAIALLFAIYLVKPSPFCILDEVDAPLDDANIDRFSKIIRRFSTDTQFIIITHNKKTMEVANMLYGVTMEEKGVSKLVSVRFNDDVPA